MLKEWKKFKGWVVLEYFLNHPNERIHVKELARRLKVSPLTANTYLRSYAKEKILERKEIGNMTQYSLIDNPLIRRLKQFYALAWIQETGFVEAVINENKSVTGIALYGTRASGEYDEKSDFDILIFSIDPMYPKKAVSLLEKDVTLSIYSLAKWRKMNKEFRDSVSKNYVVLYGAGLPE